MWKKIAAGLLAGMVLAVTTACGSPPNAAQERPQNTTPEAGGGHVLVVYFSASGHTKDVAETIAQGKNGTLFEIKPSPPYTKEDLDYRDDGSRVVQEHGQPDLRPSYDGDVSAWDSYDTVYIGYPLWWQQAPHVVYTFVERHDFSGKKVIPFCTSSSSPLGTSGTNLAKAAGTGDWQEGVRFSSDVRPAEILHWLKEI